MLCINRIKRGEFKKMARDTSKTAFIKTERGEDSLKYLAKLIDQEPRQITKAQYNQIVKALREQDWRMNEEDENIVINRIITRSLETPETASQQEEE